MADDTTLSPTRTRSSWIGVPEGYKRRLSYWEQIAKQNSDTSKPVYSVGQGLAQVATSALAGFMMGQEEREEAASQAEAQKLSTSAMMRASGLNPDGSPFAPIAATPDAMPAASPAPMAPQGAAEPGGDYSSAIAKIESGGRYDELGPVIAKSGDRAYGKYQVMGANIPEWTKTHLGQSMTPEQFVASPEAQEKVFQGQFGQYVQKYGPEGAARAWFAGEGGMNNPNARDPLGTSVADYAAKFNRNLGVPGGAPPSPGVNQVAQAMSSSVFPDPSSPPSLGGITAGSLDRNQQIAQLLMRGPQTAALTGATASDAPPIGVPGAPSPTVAGVNGEALPRDAIVQALMRKDQPPAMFDPQAMAQGMGYTPNAATTDKTQAIARILSGQQPAAAPASPSVSRVAEAMASRPQQVAAPGQPMNIAPPAQQPPQSMGMAAPPAGLPQRPQFSPQEISSIINNPRIDPSVKQMVLKSQQPNMEVIQGKDGGLYAYDKARPGQPIRIGSLPTERFETVNDANGRPIGQRNTLTGKMEGLPNTDTSDIREWNFYADSERRAGRTPQDFTQWMRGNKAAGKTDVNIDQRGETELSKERGKGLAKRLNDIADDGSKASEDALLYNRFGDLLSTVNTGGKTAMLEKIRQMTNGAVTLDPNTNQVQALNAAIQYIAPRLRVPGSGAQSDRELGNFLNSIPTLYGTPEGNAKILEGLNGIVEHRKQRSAIAAEWQLGDITAKEAQQRMDGLPSPFAPKAPAGQRKINSEAEFQSLKSGETFVAPDGSVRVKP